MFILFQMQCYYREGSRPSQQGENKRGLLLAGDHHTRTDAHSGVRARTEQVRTQQYLWTFFLSMLINKNFFY